MTTFDFCRRELDRYLKQICPEKTDIQLNIAPEITGGGDDLFDEYGEIRVENGKGKIIANRPRALLLCVYEFLRKLGCVFLHPSKGGEVIPQKTIEEITVNVDFIPSNRHRGIVIEGAVSVENVIELIDWAAKVGFNSYYLQFRTAFEFFKRWYSHSTNPFEEKVYIDEQISSKYVKQIVEQIKLRDMIYHAVGHGWTSDCIGISANGWSKALTELIDEQKSMLAEINGERKLFKNIPLNTQLCYSQQVVREKLASAAVDYVEKHPEIDVLHFWLADDYNNVCECDKCAKKNFADMYVEILNLIDKKFTERGIKTKVCFLVYFELYWAPKTERIINEDRFIMMFAPLFRSYTKAFEDSAPAEKFEYVKNKIEYPSDPAVYLSFWKDWKKIFNGDTFDFDYHLMWDINRDFGGEKLSNVVYKDVTSLKKYGMNGFLSCQLQRAFYPNGLTFFTLAESLRDSEQSFENIRRTYYSAAFGEYSSFAEDVYAMLENYVPFAFIREEENINLSLLKEGEKRIKDVLSNFPNVNEKSEVVKTSISILRFALENTRRIVSALLLKSSGASASELEAEEKERMDFFNRNENEFQPFVDGFYFDMITKGIVQAKKTGIYASDEEN